MNIDDVFIEYLPNAIIITDCLGKIIIKNKAAELLFQKFWNKREMAQSIFQIDANFDLNMDLACQEKKINFGRISKTVHVFKIKYKKTNNLLFIFEISRILASMQFSDFLDHIDDAILISNKAHQVEEINNAFQRLTGITTEKIRNSSLEELVQEGNVKESVSLKVFKNKSPQSMKIKYLTGKTIVWSATPSFNKEGQVEWVIATGRDISELVQLEARLFKTEKLKSKYHEKLKELECSLGKTDIIYSSDQMKSVIDIAMKAAKSDSPVFIWGESGVGKELIANLIHKMSPRKNTPFLAINCAAIPSELLESELFGYTEGAFTGAQKGGKKGLFQEVNGGTILLDEIGEMPVLMQSKLLRVLQTGELMNIGGNKKIQLNIRIMSSTNLAREKLANSVHFRQDLYYRLTVIPIYVPALRERRDDIPELVRHFLNMFNQKYNTNKKLSGGLLRRLFNYEWPGNIRELKNVIERLIIFSDLDEIREDEMCYMNLDEKKNETAQNDDVLLRRIMPMKIAIFKFQEMLIKKTLDQYGSVTKAAKILQINPATVHRIKKRMNAGPEEEIPDKQK